MDRENKASCVPKYIYMKIITIKAKMGFFKECDI